MHNNRHVKNITRNCTELDDVLQGVPLNPRLRPRIKQCRRPLPAGLPSSEKRSKYLAGPALAVFCARKPPFVPCRSIECSRRCLRRHAAPRATMGLPLGFGSTDITPKMGKRAENKTPVEWLYYSKRIIIVRWADLAIFFRSFPSVNGVFLFHVQ